MRDALADGVVHRHERALGAQGVDHRRGESLPRLEEGVAADGLPVAKVVVLRRVWEAIASPEL